MQASSSFMIFSLPSSTQHLIPPSRRRRSLTLATSIRDSDDWNFGGRIVDENMVVLRKRIHEMKMVERNYEAPAGWMDWEKKYHLAYVSRVHEGVVLLQKFLIGTRPIVGVGIMVLVGLSYPLQLLWFSSIWLKLAHGFWISFFTTRKLHCRD